MNPVEPQYPWYAVHTKSNFEQTVARGLAFQGLPHLLPTYPSRRTWSDRVKTISVPLFPGYVFCRFNPADHIPVFSVPGVAGVVSFAKEFAAVDETEIEAIQSILNSGLGAAPWPFLQVGRKVTVTKGPVRGLEGIVVEIKNRFRLVVSATLLQRSISVEVEREWVQPQ